MKESTCGLSVPVFLLIGLATCCCMLSPYTLSAVKGGPFVASPYQLSFRPRLGRRRARDQLVLPIEILLCNTLFKTNREDRLRWFQHPALSFLPLPSFFRHGLSTDWSRPQGLCLAFCRGPEGRIDSAAVSGTGGLLLAASSKPPRDKAVSPDQSRSLTDGTEPSREPQLRLETGFHPARINGMATDAEGRIVASAGQDKTVRVWDVGSGKLIRVLRPPIGDEMEGELYAVAVSPDGKTIACSGYTGVEWRERSLYLFDGQTGRLQTRLRGFTDVVVRLAYSRNGRYLAALQHSQHGLLLYRTSDYKLIGHYTGCRERSYGLDFSLPDGDGASRLVTASYDGYVRLFEVRADSLRLVDARKAPGGTRPVSAHFSPDGSLIALGYSNVRRVDVLSGRDLSLLYPLDMTGVTNGYLYVVRWSLDGRSLYAGGSWYGSPKKIAIRKWSDRGRGAYQDIMWGTSRIADIVPVPDGSMIVGRYSGSIAALGTDDKVRTLIAAAKVGFSDTPLYLSADGTTVKYGFPWGGGSPTLFSFANRGLRAYDPKSQIKLWGPVESSPHIKVRDWKVTNEPRLNGQRIRIYPHETSWSYAITPDGFEVVLGTTRYLRLLTKETEERWRVPVGDTVQSITVSGDGKLAVAGLANGTINWFRMTDGKLLVSLFPHGDRKRWVLWTTSGYYDCSEGADELLGWHINNGRDREALFYPLARFFERFFRPDVVTGVITRRETDIQVLAYLKDPAAGKPRIPPETGKAVVPEAPPVQTPVLDFAQKLPPAITFLSPRPDQTVDTEQLQVTVSAEDMGGGVEEIRLFHNGKRVTEDGKNTSVLQQAKRVEKTYALPLLEGQNTLTAVALSKDMIEGNPAEITVTRKGESRTPDLYLVLIGIDKYKNPELNLTYAGLDAASISDFFTSQPAKRLFEGIHVHAILNEKATRQGIMALFEELRQRARQKDAILLYMAGHGDMVGSEWFFIPHDVTTPEDEETVKKLGISAKEITEILRAVKAQKIFVIIDACKSGGLISGMGGLRGYEDRKVMKQLVRSTGTYVMSASTEKQYAAEVKELGHGVLTYAVIEGLQEKAGEKKVTVEGLIQYVKNRLPELTEKYRGVPQWPVSWGSGMDFPLALY